MEDPVGRSVGTEGTRFAAAFRGSPLPMVLTDPHRADNPIVFTNAAFARLTGYAPEEVIGRNCRFLQGPESDPGAIARVRAAIARCEPVEVDLLNYRRDGTPFWNGMALSPVRDETGTLVNYFAVLTDVSPRRTREDRLAEARSHLEQDVDDRTRALQAALDQKTALLHEVDHRVKNNLQVISSLMLLKARRTGDSGGRDALLGMADRIGALATVHRLLYSAGDVSRFDLHDFAADFGSDLASGLKGDRIDLALAVEPVPVPASKAAPLALLLHELATNAVRHAFPDGRPGRIAIEAREEDDALLLSVADDGVGLAAGTPNPDGFGRGLIDMVVRQMRGSIAWDDLAPGTRARIRLPLGAPEHRR
ncbi:sensor histidine kinase [Methylobacterium oryzihabitans]|uniref:histidine kinase n=1 Tax=Methylobacterium oryzihabitans TaxID=2499852 RepID=A0A437NUW1_9HYPH|nr:PAS domain-containing protein [Methylobacterium oryzihabitans]RVU13764.1 PAS domain-containing protein [Methylobacterium oryzihabitans]